ncbi:NUDIX domain-containing protein [Kitasatospora sp. NPDC059599]|uniref:NUDIX domain-containing protein n=1 Tax=Kitasatospora sp. NPDC059599 TaxID=3346880 RepID=UPI0036B2E523
MTRPRPPGVPSTWPCCRTTAPPVVSSPGTERPCPGDRYGLPPPAGAGPGPPAARERLPGPGHHEVMSGGAVDVGESHAQAAARESAEELGVRAPVRFVCAFLCRGAGRGRAGGRRSARTGLACTRP